MIKVSEKTKKEINDLSKSILDTIFKDSEKNTMNAGMAIAALLSAALIINDFAREINKETKKLDPVEYNLMSMIEMVFANITEPDGENNGT